MKSNLLRKLKSIKGESLSEVLVASLVMALAILMLAMMVQTSTRIVRRADDTLNLYRDEANGIESRNTNESSSITSMDTFVTISGSLHTYGRNPALQGNESVTLYGPKSPDTSGDLYYYAKNSLKDGAK